MNDSDRSSIFMQIFTDKELRISMANAGLGLFRGSKELFTGVIISTSGVSRRLSDSTEWNEAITELGDRTTFLAKVLAVSAWRSANELMKKSRTLALPSTSTLNSVQQSVVVDARDNADESTTLATDPSSVSYEKTKFQYEHNDDYFNFGVSRDHFDMISDGEDLLCDSLRDMLNPYPEDKQNASDQGRTLLPLSSRMKYVEFHATSRSTETTHISDETTAFQVAEYLDDTEYESSESEGDVRSTSPRIVDTILVSNDDSHFQKNVLGLEAIGEHSHVVGEFMKSTLWCTALALGRYCNVWSLIHISALNLLVALLRRL